jgi:hypothetical protein
MGVVRPVGENTKATGSARGLRLSTQVLPFIVVARTDAWQEARLGVGG